MFHPLHRPSLLCLLLASAACGTAATTAEDAATTADTATVDTADTSAADTTVDVPLITDTAVDTTGKDTAPADTAPGDVATDTQPPLDVAVPDVADVSPTAVCRQVCDKMAEGCDTLNLADCYGLCEYAGASTTIACLPLQKNVWACELTGTYTCWPEYPMLGKLVGADACVDLRDKFDKAGCIKQ